MMDDSNGVTHRLKRYANVTTSLGGSALKFAGAKVFGLDVAHEAEAEALTKALGQLKGPVMKVAQMLATIPDAVQPEYASAFLQLQSQAPSMGAAFVKRRMQKELGIQWRDCFAEFSLEAAAAASLGQVHRASLPDGTSVACKLQYPDMASTLEADLNQLRLFLKLYEKTLGALDTEGLFVEISSRLREELDYRLEAKHMALFQKVLADIDGVHVPTSFPDLSTDRLLTMAWLEGKPLRAMQDLPQEQRNQIARTLFRTWYVPFYHYGLIHGDPHLGNYTFTDAGEINLLDFGCVRKFTGTFVQGVLDLYHALQRQDEEAAVAAYEAWGFQGLTKEKIEVLNLWAGLLYEPIMDDRVRPIQAEHSGVYGRETAYEVHESLRRLGGVRPPQEFVFMDRAAVGVGSVFMHLRAELNWYEEFQKLIADFSADQLQNRQNQVLASVGL